MCIVSSWFTVLFKYSVFTDLLSRHSIHYLKCFNSPSIIVKLPISLFYQYLLHICQDTIWCLFLTLLYFLGELTLLSAYKYLWSLICSIISFCVQLFTCSEPFWFSFHFLLCMLLFSRSVVSDSLQPHRLQHARLPCPSLFPGACSNAYPLSQ